MTGGRIGFDLEEGPHVGPSRYLGSIPSGSTVAVLGAGGHGTDIAEIARTCGYTVEFYDDDPDANTEPPHHLPPTRGYVVGVNNPATKRRLAAVGTRPVTLVHPTATVATTAILRPGVVVGAGTHIGPDTHLGDHVHVGAGCTITRTHVAAYTTIAPGVDIAGDCIVGTETLIGVGAKVRHLINIGSRVTVGAGAVVVAHVASGDTVAGVPARPLNEGNKAA